ncbi:MAG: hypothetical protein AAF810_12770 [Cyanobacteria bacterium P01_D01_bin.36]
MTQTMQAMTELLERIAIALETTAQPPVAEGFFNYGQKVYCNLTKGNGEGWYTFEDGNAFTQKPIFRGRVVGLRFPSVERRGKDVVKFHLFMRAGGETIIFEAGQDCFFSKTVLSALAQASPEVLSRPLQMATYPKELRTGDKTLAVSLRDSAGNRLACDWTNDDDWAAITGLAVENARAAVGG